MDIGQKIHQLRVEKGMTLEELGNKVGVGKSTIRKWEIGMIENMKRDKIAKLAEALEVSPGYLLGWDVEKIDEVENMYKESRQMERLNKYAEILSNLSLTDEEAEQTIKYATFLKESREGANNEDKRQEQK